MFDFLTMPFFLGLGIGTFIGAVYSVGVKRRYNQALEELKKLKD